MMERQSAQPDFWFAKVRHRFTFAIIAAEVRRRRERRCENVTSPPLPASEQWGMVSPFEIKS
jgi:hypothetical protein